MYADYFKVRFYKKNTQRWPSAYTSERILHFNRIRYTLGRRLFKLRIIRTDRFSYFSFDSPLSKTPLYFFQNDSLSFPVAFRTVPSLTSRLSGVRLNCRVYREQIKETGPSETIIWRNSFKYRKFSNGFSRFDFDFRASGPTRPTNFLPWSFQKLLTSTSFVTTSPTVGRRSLLIMFSATLHTHQLFGASKRRASISDGTPAPLKRSNRPMFIQRLGELSSKANFIRPRVFVVFFTDFRTKFIPRTFFGTIYTSLSPGFIRF